jgi:hypothetical protein
MAVGAGLCHPPAMLTLLLLSLPIFSPPPPSGVVVPIPDGARPLAAVWSPDGRGVAICRPDGVYLASTQGELVTVWSGAPCLDLSIDDAGLVIASGDAIGPWLWRFDGRDLEPIEAPRVGAVVSEGDALVITTEHEVQRVRGGQVVARAAVPDVVVLHPTQSGYLAVMPGAVVALDHALQITGRWAPPDLKAAGEGEDGVQGEPPGLRSVVGVGDRVVVADTKGWLHSLDAQARRVAQAPHHGGGLTEFSQENQILVGQEVRSVPGLELLGWQRSWTARHPKAGPGLVAWVGPWEVTFRPLDGAAARRGRISSPTGLALRGDQLVVADRSGWASIIDVGEGQVAHEVPTCDRSVDLVSSPSGPFWLLCIQELIRLDLDGQLTRYPVPTSQWSTAAALALDAQGRPHVLNEAGLHRLDEAGQFSTRPEVRLPSPEARLMFSPGGEAVISTYGDLTAYGPGAESRMIPVPSDTSMQWDARWVGDRLWTAHTEGVVARAWPGLAEVARARGATASRLLALPGGDVVALGDSSSRLRPTGEEVWSAPSDGLFFAHDPRRDVIWSIRTDGAISRQSMADGTSLRALPPIAPLEIMSLAWLPNGALVAIDHASDLWSWSATHEPARRITGRYFSRAVPTAEGALLISITDVLPFGPDGLGPPPAWNARELRLSDGVDMAPNASLALWGLDALKVISLRNGEVQATLPALPDLRAAALSADGRRVAARTGGDEYHLLDVADNHWKPLKIFPLVGQPDSDPGSANRFAWLGETLLVVTDVGLVQWRPEAGARLEFPGEFTDLVVHPGGVVLAGPMLTFLDADLKLQGYAVTDEGELGPISPDGRWLATQEQGGVVVWDVATRTARARYTVWADGLWEARLADGTHRQGRSAPATGYQISK